LEMLDERHRREHAREMQRLETKQLDEVAINQRCGRPL
jgi:flagellar biosynthesis chaperone FliJ